MAYKAHEWKTGDTITTDLLNALEQGVGAAKDGAKGAKGDKGDTGTAGKDGAAGAKGADGKSVKSVALTTDAEGKVTGGTLTLSDDSTSDITVTVAGA